MPLKERIGFLYMVKLNYLLLAKNGKNLIIPSLKKKESVLFTWRN